MNLFRSFVFSLVLSLAYACTSGHGTDFRVVSPDGTLAVDVRAGDSLTYAVTRHGTPVLLPSAIALHFDDGTTPGRGAKVSGVHRSAVEREIEAPFHRQARFTERYNQLRLDFEGGYSVTFRIFDEGCAYRFETALPGGRTVTDEVAEFNFAGNPGLFAAYSDGLCNAYQSQYVKCRLSELGTEKPVLLPLAADCDAAGRVLVCESDLESYPGMFLTPSPGGACADSSRRCPTAAISTSAAARRKWPPGTGISPASGGRAPIRGVFSPWRTKTSNCRPTTSSMPSAQKIASATARG